MKKLQKLVKFWLPVVFWLILIFLFSARPTPKVSEIDWGDFVFKKVIHLIEYLILFVLLYRAFKNTAKFSNQKLAYWTLILIFFYAISDEYHQTFVPGRTGTLRDVVIDTGGGVIGLFGIWKYLPKAPPKLKNLARKLDVI